MQPVQFNWAGKYGHADKKPKIESRFKLWQENCTDLHTHRHKRAHTHSLLLLPAAAVVASVYTRPVVCSKQKPFQI